MRFMLLMSLSCRKEPHLGDEEDSMSLATSVQKIQVERYRIIFSFFEWFKTTGE